ncbi:energy transducer TonB [Thalassotalea litorea]|uniref:Energy transducer TonB n=1 Tax=Thalassotalea litorea TaxID=2020715 RepID=A0A5R9INQ0_9GAMM|nr:energy transducer TonB [Thalassotalea litorea]TLU67175.1 energy transducer TonB [Thalassotalea litorea]
MFKYLSISFFVLGILSQFSVNAEVKSKHISTTVNPTPKERVEPKYPIDAAREAREGWVELSFIIEEDGSVSNILVGDSSGSADFVRESLRAVKKWQYHPAMEGGEPIQRCVNTVRIGFSMKTNGIHAVRSKFKKNYALAEKALQEKDFAEVEKRLEKMTSYKYRHLTENDYLHVLAYEYAKAKNDPQLQLYHLEQVTMKNAPENNKLYVYSNKFNLQVALNKLVSAIETYEEIKELQVADDLMSSFDRVVEDIDVLLDSDDIFVVDGDIGDKSHWFHRLARNDFSISDINGSLNKVDIRCANKRHEFTVSENAGWSIPEGWKHCAIFVYGADNTSFKLVEQPRKNT